MKIVWNYAPINTNEVTDMLVKTTDWSPKTIQTMLKRLVQKGALTYEKNSRVFVYTPLVKKDEYLDQENNSFLKRYYDGNIASMLTNYLEKDTLSEEEIKDLQNILSTRKRKGGN
ncbi:BlaI/MecI/CopY family transcriptional regulator [Anaerocolumna sedimenticola]|uniref:BlaI/MecI/CopY family transcriptional regulator n=2 Tax=Anaerocolumna sedimenticola TaxID=2696063 RepID=A0A6P1TIK2_9FIRM|nr:BlaI/MecI/CopY family transcriptional regulator [Anaerocolumna sedimenticola]